MIALVLMLGGCQALTGATIHESVDDTGITTRVKAALAADKGSSLTRGGVETTRGVVHLTGVAIVGGPQPRRIGDPHSERG